MSSFLTPDVYTEEVSTLPPSVAAVSTAIPAFLGYTQKAVKDGKAVTNVPVRITTMLEFKEIFGDAQPAKFTVSLDSDNAIQEVTPTALSNKLYYALDHYFKNGGGACYIISLGEFKETAAMGDFLTGLSALKKEDEPTLIMLGEATALPASDYYTVCVQALQQCADLKDRFCIFDVLDIEGGVQQFRDKIGINNLKYGAAYMPYVKTTLSYVVADTDVTISKSATSRKLAAGQVEFVYDNYNGLRISYIGQSGDTPKFKVVGVADEAGVVTFSISKNTLEIRGVDKGVPPADVVSAWELFADKGTFAIANVGSASDSVVNSGGSPVELTAVSTEGDNTGTLADLMLSESALYYKIKRELAKEKITLPASAAVAGAYAATDRDRGVWKAPANISLNAVIEPTAKITSAEQETLNVDAAAGKSINAIRSFAGKGTLIWGARTLAGNDNEWRYVPVRRLFNTIEESTKKASYFAVFEPNTAATWLKVKAMIDSYLYGLWQQGAFAGATAEQAYFVNIGLGKTMTQQDILEGRMIVEIGVAAVRPAEFIVLRFSHKLQES